MSRTFYDVLGVSPDAATDEITTAYRERIKETHPDVSDAADAEEQAKRVIEAKEVLTDGAERDRYDRLGHDAYVRQTNVDGDWDATTDGPAQAGEGDTGADSDGGAATAESGTGTGSNRRRHGRSKPGPGAGAESVYEGTWATNGVSDSESDSSSDADASDSAAEGDSGTDSDSGTGTGATSGGPDAGDSTPGDGASGADSGSPSGGRDRRRRGRSRGSNGTSNVGDGVGWAASVDGQHAVRQGHGKHRLRQSGLFPPGQSSVLLVSTFVCYPAMVFSTFYPPFPLVVNAIVGCCTLLVIAYLMSMPEVGVYVFGGWSALATLSAIAYGVFPFSLLGMLLLGSTWVPLGLTLATYKILQW